MTVLQGGGHDKSEAARRKVLRGPCGSKEEHVWVWVCVSHSVGGSAGCPAELMLSISCGILAQEVVGGQETKKEPFTEGPHQQEDPQELGRGRRVLGRMTRGHVGPV